MQASHSKQHSISDTKAFSNAVSRLRAGQDAAQAEHSKQHSTCDAKASSNAKSFKGNSQAAKAELKGRIVDLYRV